MNFVGLVFSSIMKMHGPKNQIKNIVLDIFTMSRFSQNIRTLQFLKSRFLPSAKPQDRLWDPISFLLDGYRGSVRRIKWPQRDVDYSIHLQPWLRMEFSTHASIARTEAALPESVFIQCLVHTDINVG